jgi:3-dehydroquinate synthase
MYEIGFGSNVLPRFRELVSESLDPVEHWVCLIDAGIERTHGRDLLESLRQGDQRVSTFIVPSGESSKSIEMATKMWQWMVDESTDRKSVVITIGGGVVGDLGGFVAASFARGLRFVQVPTTLLAQVDSSVGGKTAVNLPAVKNIVGAFWQPSAVVIDTATLDTLPDRDFYSGLGEIVKYGVIADETFFSYLEGNVKALVHRDATVLQAAIRRSCEIKSEVVADDERETTGRRAILNYGHTFAHALESACGYGALLHGEAVSIGMMMAAELAVALGRWSSRDVDRQRDLLIQCRLPVDFSGPTADELIELMQTDKKVEYGKLKLVLPTRMGQVESVADVQGADIKRAIQICRCVS